MFLYWWKWGNHSAAADASTHASTHRRVIWCNCNKNWARTSAADRCVSWFRLAALRVSACCSHCDACHVRQRQSLPFFVKLLQVNGCYRPSAAPVNPQGLPLPGPRWTSPASPGLTGPRAWRPILQAQVHPESVMLRLCTRGRRTLDKIVQPTGGGRGRHPL